MAEKEIKKLYRKIPSYDFLDDIDVLIKNATKTKEPTNVDAEVQIFQEDFINGTEQNFLRYKVWVKGDIYTIYKPGDTEQIVELSKIGAMIFRSKLLKMKMLDKNLKEVEDFW